MSDAGMGRQGGQALARALESGNLSQLQYLKLYDWQSMRGGLEVGDEAMAEVIKGMVRCRQTVRWMHLSCTSLGQQLGRALLHVLRGGPWPGLEWISLSHNRGLGGEVVLLALAEVCRCVRRGEGGNLPRLTGLEVYDVGQSEEGAERLLGALGGRACPVAVYRGWVERLKERGIAVERL